MILKILEKVIRLVIFVKRLGRFKQASLGVALLAVVAMPAAVLAIREPSQSSDKAVAHVKANDTETADKNAPPDVNQQLSTSQEALKAAQKPFNQSDTTEENTKPQQQAANTGDLPKQHPAPGTSKRPPSTGELTISKSTFTIRVGGTIDNAFTAKAPSGETISPASIIHEESTPGTENALSLSHSDGSPTPMYTPTRHVNLVAPAGAAPGTYNIVMKAASDPYMNDNVTVYTATLTVTILP